MSAIFSKEINILKDKFSVKSNNADDEKNSYDSSSNSNSQNNIDSKTALNKEKSKTGEESHNNSGGIKVSDGKIIVIGDIDDVQQYTITSCDGIKLYINDESCTPNVPYKLTSLDSVRYECDTVNGENEIKHNVTKDKLQVVINIIYNDGYKFVLKDSMLSKNLKLQCERKILKNLDKYTADDVKQYLKDHNIKYGFIDENIEEACVNGTGNSDAIAASGIKAVDDIPSELKILFDLGEKNLIDQDTNERIDYKNVYSIASVKKGEVLGEIIPAIEGKNGIDVYGSEIKRKTFKNKPIKIGEGCMLQEDLVVATKDGRPSSKNGVISVNNVYETQNVDMKSGNINFKGDVEISDSVMEGMKVTSGNSLFVRKDVESAVLSAGGEINVSGSAINSKITTGQIDLEKKLYLDSLEKYGVLLKQLIDSANKLDETSNYSKKIGEIVKILIENKFKEIPKIQLSIITHGIKLELLDNPIVEFIRSKMTGAKISDIRSLSELEELLELIVDEINFYSDDMIIQSDINLSYVQDCNVKSTGNIVITGKGSYVSELVALKNVEFTNSNSVARGGFISARGNVKLGTVGSKAGITTKIEVPKEGIITADIAYANTVFCFGTRSRMLEVDSKDVKAYVDKDNEIVIDKLLL